MKTANADEGVGSGLTTTRALMNNESGEDSTSVSNHDEMAELTGSDSDSDGCYVSRVKEQLNALYEDSCNEHFRADKNRRGPDATRKS